MIAFLMCHCCFTITVALRYGDGKLIADAHDFTPSGPALASRPDRDSPARRFGYSSSGINCATRCGSWRQTSDPST